jgi:hypothetical protein
MKMLPYLTSIATLLSLFVLGPALGRAMFPQGSQLIQAFGRMVAIVGLLFLYGMIWIANPSLVSWYTWLAEIPINGSALIEK